MRRTNAIALVLTGLALQGGCNAVGALFYKFTPPQKVPALYTPAPEPAVVLVENAKNPGGDSIDVLQIGRLVMDQLRKNNAVPLVDDNALGELRDKDEKAFAAMSTAAIGRAVGARQIIYVDLQKADLTAEGGSQMVHGVMKVTVRVVDAATGDTRWPIDMQSGYPLGIDTQLVRRDRTDAQLRREMQESIATQIGHLFFPYYNENEAAEPE